MEYAARSCIKLFRSIKTLFSLSWNEYGMVKELSAPSNAATQREILAKSALLFAVR